MSLLPLSWICLSLLLIWPPLVAGKCYYVSNSGDRLAANCDVVSLEDYQAISSLDPGTTDLICNIPGILNDSLANFGHLRQLQTLQLLSPSKYTIYEMAALHGAQSSIKRVDIFENLTNLEELRINIALLGFNWDAIRYIPKLRVLDVSHTQMKASRMADLFSAMQKYKPPLQNLTMRGTQRVDMIDGTVPLEMGNGVYKFLRNIPLKILDLMDNHRISLQPGVSVHLPHLEILRIGANRLLTATFQMYYRLYLYSLTFCCILLFVNTHFVCRRFLSPRNESSVVWMISSHLKLTLSPQDTTLCCAEWVGSRFLV